MRIKHNQLKRELELSTPLADQLFLQWLNNALRDERWRAIINEWMSKTTQVEIQF